MGLDVGLEQTGRFRIRACVEKEPHFCGSIRANKVAGRLDPDLLIFESDISDLDPGQVLDTIGLRPGELDLLVGGPPCQSFSTAGNRGTVQDPRGTLLWQFLRFVEVMKPRAFLMENVRGLISAALRHRPIADRPENGGAPLEADERPGSVVKLFAEELQKLAGCRYHMDCFEVNAVNYGAPQLRERALFIGNRFSEQFEFPAPTHGGIGTEGGQQSKQSNLFEPEMPALRPWRTLRDVISDLKETQPEVLDFSPRKKQFLSLIPPGSNWRSLPIELQKESMGSVWYAKGGRSGWWRRLTYDLPCPTLLTMPNHASTSLCHPVETRALSVREYSRIQEFPDDWVFQGTLAERYAQVGNAVPVRLGKVAGEMIASQLDELRRRNWKSSGAEPGPYRTVYLQSHIRTRQWFKDGTPLVWEDGGDNRSSTYSRPRTLRKTRLMEKAS